MPKVQHYEKTMKHIFPNEECYIKAMERGEVAEGDEIIIEDDGTSDLPSVTEADEGKVLQVDGGEWAKKHLTPCDEELSQMSANAIQNKAVAAKFAEVETTIGNIDVLLGTI